MAGGIEWFRWHHGSVTDPKFQLVAKKSKSSLPEVLSVWAFILEAASSAHDRGHFGEIDCDSVDCLFGMDDGKTAAILTHMQERGLIADNCVCNWSKRQPKREDDTSAERKRRQRERDHENELANSVTNTESRNVTQCHADVTHGHDRGEESREEGIDTPPSVARRSSTGQKTLSTYLKECKDSGVKPIPDDHHIRAYCRDAGITTEMASIAWLRFREDHTIGTRKAKRYTDWPGAFANSVKDRWYRLWVVNAEGEANWTNEGMQARRVVEAQEVTA